MRDEHCKSRLRLLDLITISELCQLKLNSFVLITLDDTMLTKTNYLSSGSRISRISIAGRSGTPTRTRCRRRRHPRSTRENSRSWILAKSRIHRIEYSIPHAGSGQAGIVESQSRPEPLRSGNSLHQNEHVLNRWLIFRNGFRFHLFLWKMVHKQFKD